MTLGHYEHRVNMLVPNKGKETWNTSKNLPENRTEQCLVEILS